MRTVSVCFFDDGSPLVSRAFENVAKHVDCVITLPAPSPIEMYNNGFAFWRNLLVDACKTDYVIMINADEYFSNPEMIRQVVENSKALTVCINHAQEGFTGKEFYQSPRIFKRSAAEYCGWLHEELFLKVGKTYFAASTEGSCLHLWHTPELKGEEICNDRNLLYNALLYKIVKHPELRPGTNINWYTKFWDEHQGDITNMHSAFCKKYGVQDA